MMAPQLFITTSEPLHAYKKASCWLFIKFSTKKEKNHLALTPQMLNTLL